MSTPTFKRFLNPTHADFVQAVMEAAKFDKLENINESVSTSTHVETDGSAPGYDKRTAYAMYGEPTENPEKTAEKIKAHELFTGRKASATTKKRLKVFEHDPNSEGGISKLFKYYGPADPKLISSEDRKKEVIDNFRKFSELEKTDPKQYAKKVNDLKSKKLGNVLDSKTKTDTVSSLKGTHEGEENGHESFGFGGNPDIRRHYTDTKGNYIEGNACHGKGNCVYDCLAKNGCGGFDITKGHRDAYDQRSSHNAAARYDHDLDLYNQLYEITKKAKKNKKGVVVRPDVTTGHQHTEYADAISEHYGPNSEKVKSGKHAAVRVDTYGKMAGTDKDPHSRAKGINTAISDQGDPNNKRDIADYNKTKSLLRQKGNDARIVYSVTDAKHHKDNKDGTEKPHKNPEDEEKWKKTLSVKASRWYDLNHSNPGSGEGEDPKETREEYHNDKTKSGRVKYEGKSYYYSEHKNPEPIEDVNGNKVITSYHDGRGLELDIHIKNHPNEHGINAVSPATASTHFNKNKPSIFRSSHNIDSHGIRHVMHPASPEAKKARAITKTIDIKS